MRLRCPVCRHDWPPSGPGPEVCPRCLRKARDRAARERGPGTSEEVGAERCRARGAVGERIRTPGER